MKMPFVETLEHARHFIQGPAAYEGAPSPWKEAVKSPQRPDSMNGGDVTAKQPAERWLPL
jgi:hypothetical protein